MTTLAPRNSDEVIEAIRWACSAGEALEVVGSGSRRALGRPVSAAHVLDVSALSGIVSYEPAELVLTARAGTPMHVIEATLAEHAQCLAFEPPDLAALLGTGGGAIVPCAADAGRAETTAAPSLPVPGTLGGAIATGLSGPRRFRVGAARDHVLGIAAVSGRAETFVAGGKVVKNVTGYDIPKLMTGSYGTLAVFTEITVKVLPAPEDVRTLLVGGLSVSEAVQAMTRVLQSTADATGACHLPSGVVMAGRSIDRSATAFRLEGFTPSVEFRLAGLRDSLGSLGALTVLDRNVSVSFWRAVRDVTPFADAGAGHIWRISVPPAEGAGVAARLERALPDAKMFLDWGGGLIWLAAATSASADAHHDVAASATRIRESLGNAGGHATLIRAPALLRASVDVFQPQSAAVAALSKRVKAQFDPAGILNPGRMYPSA